MRHIDVFGHQHGTFFSDAFVEDKKARTVDVKMNKADIHTLEDAFYNFGIKKSESNYLIQIYGCYYDVLLCDEHPIGEVHFSKDGVFKKVDISTIDFDRDIISDYK